MGNTTHELNAYIAYVGFLRLHHQLATEKVNDLSAKYTKEIFADGAQLLARKHQYLGANAFYYQISWGAGQHLLGAGHGIELPLVFGVKNFRYSKFLMDKEPNLVHDKGKAVRELWGAFCYGALGKGNHVLEVDHCLRVQKF